MQRYNNIIYRENSVWAIVVDVSNGYISYTYVENKNNKDDKITFNSN